MGSADGGRGELIRRLEEILDALPIPESDIAGFLVCTYSEEELIAIVYGQSYRDALYSWSVPDALIFSLSPGAYHYHLLGLAHRALLTDDDDLIDLYFASCLRLEKADGDFIEYFTGFSADERDALKETAQLLFDDRDEDVLMQEPEQLAITLRNLSIE